jgi:hypothetical protein
MSWKDGISLHYDGEYAFYNIDFIKRGVWNNPTIAIRDEKDDVFKMRVNMRYSDLSVNTDRDYARVALCGTSLTKRDRGAWPHMDFTCYWDFNDEIDDGKSDLIIEDAGEMRVVRHDHTDEYLARYNIKLNGEELEKITIIGRDSWRTLTGSKEEKNGSGELTVAWLGGLINKILSLVSKDVLRQLPFDIMDIIPMTYDITYQNKKIATIRSNANPWSKKFTMNLSDELTEKERAVAMGHYLLLLYYNSCRFRAPELVSQEVRSIMDN